MYILPRYHFVRWQANRSMSYCEVGRTISSISRSCRKTSTCTDFNATETLKRSYRRTSASDGISSANQTNLALKGVIGVGAMAQICSVVGRNDDANRYQVRTSSYAQKMTYLIKTCLTEYCDRLCGKVAEALPIFRWEPHQGAVRSRRLVLTAVQPICTQTT